MKRILLLLFLTSILSAQALKLGEAKGLFMGISVGPRFPVGTFSDSHGIGIGGNVSFSYTDNLVLPLFYYLKIGYQHNPGNQNYYKTTDYSSISTDMVTISPGARFYFPPFLENVVILMPVIEAGFTYSYSETWNNFKSDSNRKNFYSDVSSYGFHISGGFSMFLLDVMLSYYYLKDFQSVDLDLSIRIPIFMKM